MPAGAFGLEDTPAVSPWSLGRLAMEEAGQAAEEPEHLSVAVTDGHSTNTKA